MTSRLLSFLGIFGSSCLLYFPFLFREIWFTADGTNWRFFAPVPSFSLVRILTLLDQGGASPLFSVLATSLPSDAIPTVAGGPSSASALLAPRGLSVEEFYSGLFR